jgi:hypothetical protein
MIKMMKILSAIIGYALLSMVLISCGALTREEKDVFTITERDTTFTNFVKNSPNNKDNGVVFPSSREILVERNTNQRDSEFTRYYPDFIRYGLFESIGTVGGNPDNAIGTGFFGVFPINEMQTNYKGDKSKFFSGGIYRLGIGEWRLRWFRDAKNWTVGTSLAEAILPEARSERYLISIYPIYLRKRIFLREEIPYVAVTPAFGIGLYPSQYVNFSTSLDVGSIGGLNVRAYLGLAFGYNSPNSPLNKNDRYKEAQTVSYPYVGLGISFLDFLNLVPETLVEWKDHQHSAWEVGIAELSLLNTNAEMTIFRDTSKTNFIKGFDLQAAKVNLAIPYTNNRFYAGTSLFRMLVLGKREWGLGILPLRVGYWHTIIDDELTATPFLEFAFYPSSYVNIGGEVNLRIFETFSVGAKLGYISGNSEKVLNTILLNNLGIAEGFENYYFGFTIKLDRVFFEKELRYNRPELPKSPRVYK